MKYSVALASAIVLVNAAPNTYPGDCSYDSCLFKDKIPAKFKPAASKYCISLVGSPKASTTTVGPKTTIIQTVTPQSITVTATDTATTTATSTITSTISSFATDTQTSAISCSTTITTAPTTNINYPRFTPTGNARRDAAEINEIQARQQPPGYGNRSPKYPNYVTAGCNKDPSLDKVKAACKCFLAPPVVTVTRRHVIQTTTLPQQTQTLTQSVTVTASQTTTEFVTTTSTSTTTSETCTSTSTSIVLSGQISSCGAPPGTYASATTGQVTCTQPVNAPSGSINAFHRIEADNTQGTVFEGCIYAGPRSITTSSGGTHQCGASMGTSITSQTDAAAMLTGFTYDGSFSSSFNDYFITRIGSTSTSGNSYWGVLNNGVFTSSGGCGAQVRPGDSSLWQWDAFNLQSLLTITPQYAVVAPGGVVSLQVTSRSPNGGGSSPFGGAVLSNGENSDSNGNIAFNAPSQPGCYQYKAEGRGAGRSNAFYLNVVGGFPATIG